LHDILNSFLKTPIGYAISAVTLWCFWSFFTSLVSGWYALTRRFRAQSEPCGDTRSARPLSSEVRMRFKTEYAYVVRLTAAQDALYLSMSFLLRVGHPPLRIPWNEIHFGREEFLWLRYVVLTLGNKETIPMRISERTARKLGILERLPETERLPSELHFNTLSDSFVASQTKKPD
jgi:hypothetical protein